jgi:hypothetical protein
MISVEHKNFACLGWGSLIWCNKALPVQGQWLSDGPAMPIEFARESRDKRITLVICEGIATINTLWCYLEVGSLTEAKKALAAREGITEANIKHSVGFWSANEMTAGPCGKLIGEWSVGRNIDGVVWTALKPRFGGAQRMPSMEEVITHLRGLEGVEKDAAEEYVRLAPRQIVTSYRAAIERELGWLPSGLM